MRITSLEAISYIDIALRNPLLLAPAHAIFSISLKIILDLQISLYYKLICNRKERAMEDNARMVDNANRLRFLAQNYNWLRGWSTALGLIYIIWGIARLLGGPTVTGLIFGWLFLPSLALLALMVWALQRHYERRFGTVKAAKRPGRLLVILGAFLIFVIMARLAGPDYRNLKLACDPTVVSGGIIMILIGLLPTFPWRHYLPFGLLLIGIGFLPAIHVITIEQFRHGWNDLIVGITWLIGGMIDHVILMRKFSPIQLEDSHV